MFAKLQMDLASDNKTKAMEYIDTVKANNQKSKEYANVIAELRSLKAEDVKGYNLPKDKAQLEADIKTCQDSLKTYNSMLNDIESGKLKPYINERKDPCFNLPDADYKALKSMTDRVGKNNFPNMTRGDDNVHMKYEIIEGKQELEKYAHVLNLMKKVNDLGLSENYLGGNLTDDKLKNMIQSLQGLQQEVSTDNQTHMITIQDHIGKYNSYSQGASAAISQSNQALTQIATGR